MCIRAVHSSGIKDGAHKYIVTGVQKNSGPKAVRFQAEGVDRESKAHDHNEKTEKRAMNKMQKGECAMQLVNPLEQQNAVKTLYSEFVSPVCAKYGLTRIELDILLFLANNTRYDTATDIVEVRFLAKSQVSAAIKNLEARGCLRREYQLDNRKTAHLRLCDPAQPMIAAGRSAQEQFGAALLDGFTPEELEHMQRSMERIRKNVEKYLEDKNNDNVD